MLSLNNITPEQQRIINHPLDDDLYVEAPAGHGKTSTAMLKAGEIAKTLINHPRRQVLVLTFSKMAVRQIDYEKQQLVPKILHSKIFIKTYHAFYFDLISHYSRYLGFEHQDFGLITEDERKALYLLHTISSPGLPYPIFSYSQYLAAGLHTPMPVAEVSEPEQIRDAANFLANYHRQEQRLGFEDFSYYAYRILADSSFICSHLAYKYPFVFLDEFQNTNDLQWTILKCFIRDVKLVVFADPHQNIHGFRGAGQIIELFKQERQPITIPLSVNFRNSSSLYMFAKSIALGNFNIRPPQNVTFHRLEVYRKDKLPIRLYFDEILEMR